MGPDSKKSGECEEIGTDSVGVCPYFLTLQSKKNPHKLQFILGEIYGQKKLC